MTQFASLLILRDLPQYYTYAIPTDYAIGDHVTLSFGKTEAIGLIIALTPRPRGPYKIKSCHEKNTKLPRLPRDLVDLICWFSAYYLVSPYISYMTIIGSRSWVSEATLSPPVTPIDDYTLTPEQQQACDALLSGPQEQLLFGITGSGKTELYVHMARHYLALKKSILVLLPEINLTPQIQAYFMARFDSVVTLHSGLTPKQRNQAWRYAYETQPCIIIGPRSAIFSPVHALGLIIIDESHDQSYKQDTTPLYHVHTVARKRCELTQARLIHGTATPDITLYHRLKAATVRLNHRLHATPLPRFTCIDTTETPDIISPYLAQRLDETIQAGNKSMILLNRRGYAPYISCKFCNRPHCCEGCSLSYTYHQDRSFRCHRCLIQKPVTHRCTHCGKNGLYAKGIGIQKLALVLKTAFPNACIMRLDRDTGRTFSQQSKILASFRESGDILIGTQMIAKGHHIDRVTLVGILGIETVLNSPHFRCAEQAYQLITQVAGRAGRGRITGEVILQTSQPDHYAIESALAYDYEQLYTIECESRQCLIYPPFCTLIRILVYSETADLALGHLTQCFTHLQATLTDIPISDPLPAPLEKNQNYYRYHCLIKVPESARDRTCTALRSLPKCPKSVRRLLDLEPVTII